MNLFDQPRFENAKFPPPRDFQESAHKALRAGAAAGHRTQVLMASTGSGKTFLGLRICHEALARGRSAIFVCDRTTLIDQTSARADEYGIAHSVMQSTHWRYDRNEPFQICSAQTLARRKWPEADVIVIDEVHTQMKSWTQHIPNIKAHVVGLSATPFSRGLGKLFTNLVNATTQDELTKTGILVPMRVKSCTPTNMEGAETKGGEWTDAAAQERGLEIVGDVVKEWIQHGEGRKTIVFGATIAHCEEIARQFNNVGVCAAVFCSHTTPAERKALLDEYRKQDSRLRVLVSVEALAKGFDVPDVGCVVDCRPLRKSLSTAMQMWGRGLRSSPGTSKTDCTLLDHSGNIMRFAEDYTEIYYNGLGALDAGEKLDKTVREDDKKNKDSRCPKCSAIPFAGHCMSCGYQIQKKSTVVALPGKMKDIVLGHGKSVSARSLWEQASTYAKQHSVHDKQRGRALSIYRNITGTWPPHGWNIETTGNVQLTKEFVNKVRSLNIAYAKTRPQVYRKKVN